MNTNSKALLAAAGIAAVAFSPAFANEGPGAATKPGAFIGASAGVPPPGIYMFNQVFTYQANLTGPGTGGKNNIGVHANVDVQGFVFVPGWTFLGATYDAVFVQPFVDLSVGTPVNVQAAGMFNTYLVPVELSWKLGTSGFAFKTGLGIYVPDGTKTGFNGLGNSGSPYYTFQPEAIFSYLANGWNLSAAIYEEFNTANSVTHYTSGDILHADFTATKTIGKWTIGPVAYYWGQVSSELLPGLLRRHWRQHGGSLSENRCVGGRRSRRVRLRTGKLVGLGNPGSIGEGFELCRSCRVGSFRGCTGRYGVRDAQLSSLGA